MAPSIYLTTLVILFGTILAIFAMRYASAVHQARAKSTNSEAWREVAEKAAAAEAQTATALISMQATLTELGARLTAVETILKEVG